MMTDFDKQQAQLLRMLWIGFLFSTLVWGGIAWVLTGPAAASPPGPASELSFSDPLFVALCLAAICLFILAAQIGRFFPLGSADDEARKKSHRFQIPLIRFALFESIGLLGLVGALVKVSFETCLPFLLLAVAGLLMSRPRSPAT